MAPMPIRRKSHGSIRSPHVKRNSQSQVILEGWLYKLEGGAIKQFKQRWCVLVDFCLFFYKAPREEKTTSSILLPSYKISPCTSEDKVSKKFSFKAEHQNMKTYYFAAEDKDSMTKWMNAMSLASIMQNFTRLTKADSSYKSPNHEDEDSGFTSYQSRRYVSQKLNTTHNSNYTSEPLQQRSSSHGDRIGEVYLGSDDKYPNVYKDMPSSHQTPEKREMPRRQPLYANAPPKPRRLTQSENFDIIYKDCYGQEVTLAENAHYSYDRPVMSHPDQHYPQSFNSSVQNQHYFVDSDPMQRPYTHHSPKDVPDLYRNQPETVTDLYRSQPPRPRSADFLEREPECAVVPDVALYHQSRRQPQRPKSSLEYYDRYSEDTEDCNFDYYREAVRIQADNLYSNKNLNKTRRYHPPSQNNPQSDYPGSEKYLVNEEMSPCYASTTKNLSERYEALDISILPSPYESESSRKLKNSSEESMQRLLEWKQRMLQSPLSKRNQPQCNSSGTSSPMVSPLKSYNRQVIPKHLMASNYANTDKTRSHSASPQRHNDNLKSFSSPCKYENVSPAPTFSNIGKAKFSPRIPEPSLDSSVDISAEDLYKENVMYCVDSENNEILFACNDNPSTISNSHYPPQMHSFTTMPNVSNIGSDKPEAPKYDEQDALRNMYAKEGSIVRSNQEFKGSCADPTTVQQTTYSSDDEDNELKEHEPKMSSEENKQRCKETSQDKHQLDRYHSSSPDYVNIGAICGNSSYRPGTEVSSHKINHAVLKPLEQASKNKKLPVINQQMLEPEKIPNSNFCPKIVSQDNSYHTDTGSLNDSFQNQSFISKTSYESDAEFDIKREDYYRASQIFYASTRVKNKQSVSKRQKETQKSSIVSNQVFLKGKHSYVNVTLSDSVSSLDKDIGIPIQTSPYKSLPVVKPPPDVLENNYSGTKPVTTFNSDCTEDKHVPSLESVKDYNQLNTAFTNHKTDDKVSNALNCKDNTNQNKKEIVSAICEPGKKLSYEEMRGQLLRKREAPPPNIVQDRIKKFEVTETTPGSNLKTKTEVKALKHLSGFEKTSCKERLSLRLSGKRNRYKANRSRSYRRALHSDSETVVFGYSDDSSDDLTMKSAPILSPFSSVLADLRKTAESEKVIKSASSVNITEEYESKYKDLLERSSVCDEWKELKPLQYNECYDKIRESIDEAEYLPMFGSKSIKEKESEYVMMGRCKSNPNSPANKTKKFFSEEEHVYNEPFSPPPSFLHDVYEKQKTKQFQNQLESSSSEDSLTENIYEKPMYRFSSGSSRNLRNEYSHKAVQETNSILMSSLSCSNVTSVGQPIELDRRSYQLPERNKSSLHHYEQANVSVSVPDLLQLQEMKDSDASDADDEASRDFDTVGEAPLPSYQSPILNPFDIARRDGQLTYSDVPFVTLPSTTNLSHLHSHQSSLSDSITPNSAVKIEVKPLPTYEALYNVATYHPSQSEPYAQSTLKSDSQGKYHMQKLRIYTKGKKPEVPKIVPVPFDLEESEICKIMERKDSAKSLKIEDAVPAISLESSITIDSDSLSENVAYASRAEVVSTNISVSIPPNATQSQSSYRPDVVPMVQEDKVLPNEKYSPSKSPNSSAPYYYSDLYSGHVMPFAALFRKGDVPYIDKTSPPRSNSALLNNVKTSPISCKGDIGRKVNKINSRPPSVIQKDALNENSVLRHGAKSNIQCSIDILQGSISKYLDAEKNKYEAGHTLEKTRANSTMPYFKHRASTPDLNTSSYQLNEPVYENIAYQSKPKLKKRLSHSLEGLPNFSDFNSINEDGDRETCESPVYENIDFFQKEMYAVTEGAKIEELPQDFEVPQSQVTSSHNVFPERQFCSIVSKPEVQSAAFPIDNEPDFLDQNVLRRVSEQHFFGKNFKQSFSSQMETEKQQIVERSFLSCSSSQVFDLQSTTTFNEIQDYKMNDSFAARLYGDYKTSQYDSDTSIGATSSCDEASLDSDHRHRYLTNKNKAFDMPRSASTEIFTREPHQLKKLVQQSEGLMCKGKRLSVSAGDLLGKTHEELVLLLIQLRRNQAKLLKTKDRLKRQMQAMQEIPRSNIGKQTSYQSINDLQKQIQLLENQHEITQPLVTLVDNMIKLGSLYGSSHRRSFSLPVLDTSQEVISAPSNATHTSDDFGESSILTKLLADESTFQKRISEIYSLDKGLRHETNSITSLHQDKEMLEYTLNGMHSKILDHQDRPSELHKLKKQQRLIEKELIRVKRLLSTSAKKIEDAASKNDQMEKDILHLRQILKEALKTGSSESKSSQHNRADIEAELLRVQTVLDELANHRHEINNTVMKLKGEVPSTLLPKDTDFNSNPPSSADEQQMFKSSKVSMASATTAGIIDDKESTNWKKVKNEMEVRASPTGVAGSAPLPVRKKQHSMYLETDLDTMVTRDLASLPKKELENIPVYENADEINNASEEIYENLNTIDNTNSYYNSQSDTSGAEQCSMQDINDADERMKRFYGIIPKEKPSEIKTVRIVKRQSERRNRVKDKKRVTYDDQTSMWLVEEPDVSSSDDLLEIEESSSKPSTPLTMRPSSINLLVSSLNRQSNAQSAHERLFGNSSSKSEKPLSTSKQDRAYPIKRTKRRHYTVSGYQYALDPQFSHYFKDQPRSRDDVDMERCLRTANTPDIVRSTIKKNDVFDDEIIDRELGLPQKIEIPERYVEIEPEQLSATERLRRSIKAENICKMLSETTTSTYGDVVEEKSNSLDTLHKKLSEEKKKRAHLLNLNRAIAREVVEKSKAVAVFATLDRMMRKPLTPVEETCSPVTSLPITQQRYNFLS